LSSSHDSVEKKDEKYHFTLEDLEKIHITRDNIERWWEYNIFKTTVVGCFIKINVSAKSQNDVNYMIFKIDSIEELPNNQSYLFCGKKCTYQIMAEHASNKKLFNFNVVSNQKFTEMEFISWQTRMEKVVIIILN